MGMGGNPALGMLARNVIQSLSQRGAGPSTMGGPQGSAPDIAGQALSSRLNELQGADPGAILRKLTQMKSELIQMIPFVAFALPGVSKHISKMWTSLDSAIKEAEQAASTQNTVQSTPVGMQAASPQPGQGPQPNAGGTPWLSAAPGA